MIGTVLRIGWLNLKRDRVAQVLTFVLPIVFFTIFALVFGDQDPNRTSRIEVAVVDEDHSELSGRFVEALGRESSVRVRATAREPDGRESPLDRARAEGLVRAGDLPVALILPADFGRRFPNFSGDAPPIELLADTSDPVAAQMLSGLLQKVAMTAAPDRMMQQGLDQFERFGGAFTPDQKKAVDQWLPMLRQLRTEGIRTPESPKNADRDGPAKSSAGTFGLVAVKVVDVLGQNKTAPLISFYAAGTAVMFVLFSCSGAGGALIEEAESGTLERLLASQLGMGRLLAGKWLFLTALGILQVTLMFVWGALVFGLELRRHLLGFALMTSVTCAAASGFGLVLATACRSRGQLSGVSTIVVLVMSAVGGSMFPRFLMSETLQKIGLVTFNAWALDGYVKVFWRDVPAYQLWPQWLVLGTLAGGFMTVARLLARRWETI
jgi:ABC-2 type transport system permease protein